MRGARAGVYDKRRNNNWQRIALFVHDKRCSTAERGHPSCRGLRHRPPDTTWTGTHLWPYCRPKRLAQSFPPGGSHHANGPRCRPPLSPRRQRLRPPRHALPCPSLPPNLRRHPPHPLRQSPAERVHVESRVLKRNSCLLNGTMPVLLDGVASAKTIACPSPVRVRTTRG